MDAQQAAHRYHVGQVCVFTNRGASGVESNNGKCCRIGRLKEADEWFQEEPEYVIEFLGESHRIGARECELEPIT